MLSVMVQQVYVRSYLDDRIYTKRHTACSCQWSCQRRKRLGVVHIDQRINMVPGRPSVVFRRQLCHILRDVSQSRVDGDVEAYCGMICILLASEGQRKRVRRLTWTHQQLNEALRQ